MNCETGYNRIAAVQSGIDGTSVTAIITRRFQRPRRDDMLYTMLSLVRVIRKQKPPNNIQPLLAVLSGKRMM